MAFPTWMTSPHSVLLVMMTALLPMFYTACRDDIVAHTHQCWAQYDDKLYTLTQSNLYFYSGLDTEQIRQFCASLTTASQCTMTSRKENACTDVTDEDIEILVAPYAGLGNLCYYQNFYELYARSLTCFQKLKPSSEMCHTMFKDSTNAITPLAREQDRRAIHEYCSALQSFIGCFETRVRVNCDPDALPLAGLLINASLPLTSQCATNHAVSDENRPDGGGTSDRSQQDRGNGCQNVHSPSALSLSLSLITITIIIISSSSSSSSWLTH